MVSGIIGKQDSDAYADLMDKECIDMCRTGVCRMECGSTGWCDRVIDAYEEHRKRQTL